MKSIVDYTNKLKEFFASKQALTTSIPITVTKSSVNALPTNIDDARITTDMECIKAVLSNSSAQVSAWTVNTDVAGRATISGTISGTTDIKLYLEQIR